MNVITLEQAEERLNEVRGRISEIEENTSRYYELGEWRISGYDNEALYEELQDLEERLMDKISELEEAQYYEQ
jgi:chaperonin cofactor prefoldin